MSIKQNAKEQKRLGAKVIEGKTKVFLKICLHHAETCISRLFGKFKQSQKRIIFIMRKPNCLNIKIKTAHSRKFLLLRMNKFENHLVL